MFLRYIVKGSTSVDIKPAALGNSKGKGASAYYRIKESVRRKNTDTVKTMEPHEAYNKLLKEAGGIESCQSAGDSPRNYKQLANMQHKLNDSKPSKDTLFEIMNHCLDRQSRSDQFIRSVQVAPEPTCVLASDYQLNDIDRFCTNPQQFSILGVDPTFNLGDFAVTVTTYRHLMLQSRQRGQQAIMIGPIFAHQKKMAMYHEFASSLLGLKPSLKNLQCIGSDGELALCNGFQIEFPNAKHIFCFLHTRRNIRQKLSEIGITDNYA